MLNYREIDAILELVHDELDDLQAEITNWSWSRRAETPAVREMIEAHALLLSAAEKLAANR
jgi:hypothetical protein